MPASGWGSLWESSSFVPWFVLNVFRDISAVVPEWPWISGFMRKSSFRWVKWVRNVSLHMNYPQNIRNIRMYSVLYPESNFWWVFRNGSGMVPETFHISSEDMLDDLMRIQFPVSANVKICITRCVVLNSCLRKTATRLKSYVGFPHISSIIPSWEPSSFVPSCS